LKACINILITLMIRHSLSYKDWPTDITSRLIRIAGTKSHSIRSSRHSAILVRRGSVIKIGWNKLKTHPLQAQFAKNAGLPEKIFLHAETDVIIKMINQYGLKSVSGCELYLIRLKKDGTVGTSKPCPSCAGLIDYFGIDKVYHT
jgi:tRNA(Arg) A34 adenosine deaminase TadA